MPKYEPKISIIIPFTDKHTMNALRAELSVKEQDYKNVEIIKVHDKDSRGASWARNEGARQSTGEVLFFLDADCILEPGVLTQVLMEWEEDPAADFIYGQYRFMGPELKVYSSRPWNPYVLTSMNYVSTMSPMKREVWEKTPWLPDAFGSVARYGFNEELSYFQDWDFFLRAAQNRRRGRFLKQIMFLTERPDKDSISGSPKVPFWDKVKEIKRRNNIPYRPICMTTLGAPFQAEYRAEVLGADYLGANMETDLVWLPGMWGDHDYKMVYVTGFYPKGLEGHAMAFENAPEGCKFFVHWIGSDVYQLHNTFTWATVKVIKDDVLSALDYQFTTSPNLTRELDEMGIEAPVLYAPLDAERFPLLPEPKTFAVGCYVSDTNPMHNENFLLDLAKSLPQVKFFFFGRQQKEKHGNIEYIGRLENMRDVLMETSVVLRMTKHDGLPQTVLQYLVSGRDAVCNSDIAFARYVPMWPNEQHYDACKTRAMHEIIQSRMQKKTPEQRKRVREHWTAITDPALYRAKVEALLDSKDELCAPDVQPSGVSGGNGQLHTGADDQGC